MIACDVYVLIYLYVVCSCFSKIYLLNWTQQERTTKNWQHFAYAVNIYNFRFVRIQLSKNFRILTPVMFHNEPTCLKQYIYLINIRSTSLGHICAQLIMHWLTCYIANAPMKIRLYNALRTYILGFRIG